MAWVYLIFTGGVDATGRWIVEFQFFLVQRLTYSNIRQGLLLGLILGDGAILMMIELPY